MTVAYDILFRVTVNHAFYENGLSPDFRFAPTPSTKRLLDSHNLVFKPFSQGFTVFARVMEDDPLQLFYPMHENSLRFSFLMIPTNNYFYNFTRFANDRYPQAGKEVLYFSNVSVSNPPVLGDIVMPAPSGYIQLLKRPTFNLNYGPLVGDQNPTLDDLYGNIYAPLPSVSLPPDEAPDELQVDLNKVNKIRPGKYRASDPNLAEDFHFYYEPFLDGQQVFAIVEIYSDTNDFTNPPADHVNPAYQFLDGGFLNRDSDGLVADYTINLDVSAFKLRYLIRIKEETTGVSFGNLQIDGPSGGVTFTASAADNSFTSNDFFDWAELPPAFELTHSANPMFMKALPSPTVSHPVRRGIDPEPPNDEIFFYDLYIYV